MRKRAFYTAQSSIGWQFVDNRWKKRPPSWLNTKKPSAAPAGLRTQDEKTGGGRLHETDRAPVDTNWNESGCTAFCPIAMGSHSLHRFSAVFPHSPGDHLIREKYASKCIDGAAERCADEPSGPPLECFGVLLEVSSVSMDTETLANLLTESACRIGVPNTVSLTQGDSVASPTWKAHSFAPRETECEKSQVFWLRPKFQTGGELEKIVDQSCLHGWMRSLSRVIREQSLFVRISRFHMWPVHKSHVFRLQLTGVKHECILRRVHLVSSRSESPAALLSQRLNGLKDNGFVNYFPPDKLGVISHQHLAFAGAFLQENFGICLVYFLRDLEAMDNRLRHVWHNSFHRVDTALHLLTNTAFLGHALNMAQKWGIKNKQAFAILRSLIDHADRDPAVRFRDVVLRCLHYRHIDAKLHSVGEMSFNTMTSLRITECGHHVVPGDLVLPRREAFTRQNYTDLSGLVPPTAHKVNISAIPADQLLVGDQVPTLIRDVEHAKNFTLDDVVLPVVFPLKSARSFLNGVGERQYHLPSKPVWPTHTVNRERYHTFLCCIGFADGFLAKNRGLNDRIGYRHILAKPLGHSSFSEGDSPCQTTPWCWEIHEQTSGKHRVETSDTTHNRPLTLSAQSNTFANAPIEFSGRSQSTPGTIQLKNRTIITKEDHSLSSIESGPDHMTAAIRMCLPPDAFVHSALREIFHISPAKRPADNPKYKDYVEWKKTLGKVNQGKTRPSPIKMQHRSSR